jgi:hypothetical protein
MELLACVGLTFILKYGTILTPVRSVLCRVALFKELFKCSLCLGFWSGVMIGCHTNNILLPLASSGVCWFADSVVAVIQWYEIKLEKDNKV